MFKVHFKLRWHRGSPWKNKLFVFIIPKTLSLTYHLTAAWTWSTGYNAHCGLCFGPRGDTTSIKISAGYAVTKRRRILRDAGEKWQRFLTFDVEAVWRDQSPRCNFTDVFRDSLKHDMTSKSLWKPRMKGVTRHEISSQDTWAVFSLSATGEVADLFYQT